MAMAIEALAPPPSPTDFTLAFTLALVVGVMIGQVIR